jgi:hypothetical protein
LATYPESEQAARHKAMLTTLNQPLVSKAKLDAELAMAARERRESRYGGVRMVLPPAQREANWRRIQQAPFLEALRKQLSNASP